jgi:hypothetical protein
MKLERSEQSEFFPAPKITKVGDYLYTSPYTPSLLKAVLFYQIQVWVKWVIPI